MKRAASLAACREKLPASEDNKLRAALSPFGQRADALRALGRLAVERDR